MSVSKRNTIWFLGVKVGLTTVILGLMMAYVWIGRVAVPFHGDEADHLYKSQDFVVYFVKGRPQDLRVHPPVAVDSTEHIRLLTGTTSAYLTGYALWSSHVYEWPSAWYYGRDVEWNITQGNWPPDDVLQRGRIPATLLAMLSIPLAFGVTWFLEKEHPGWRLLPGLVAALLVATHPAWLLSSRRVMQEAALGTFSLGVVFVALILVNHWRAKWLLFLSIVSGLCLAAKPPGAITVGGVFLGLGWAQMQAPLGPPSEATTPPVARLRRGITLGSAGLLALGVYLILTPAIWGAPVNRLWLAAELRADVLAGQTAASDAAHASKLGQLSALVEQPFLSDLQYYETPAFANVLDQEIADYETAGLDGWQMSSPIGAFWTGMAGLGLVALWRRRSDAEPRVGLIWVTGIALALGLGVPLAWQRYYLLWSLAACILAALGLTQALHWLLRKRIGRNGRLA
ncbi:MAG: hypothetical protein GYB66_12870 [Chloroflexi bacterium]|nr:hypothetical protein [Chloroflexota bacterium]